MAQRLGASGGHERRARQLSADPLGSQLRSRGKAYIDQPVGQRELNALEMLARVEECAFFERNPHLIAPYRDRLVAAALCQGAALQYLDIGYGVHDFDIHYFYRQNPTKPRLSRTIRRLITDVGSFSSIPVDFIRTIIPARLCGASPVEPRELLKEFLHHHPTANASHLAKKAVVGLYPQPLFGLVLWAPGCPTSR